MTTAVAVMLVSICGCSNSGVGVDASIKPNASALATYVPTDPMTGTPTPHMTVYEAKAISLRTAMAIATSIPADMVSTIDQHQIGTLLRCDDKKFSWSASTVVQLKPGANQATLLEAMRLHFDSLHGYRALTTRSESNSIRVEIDGPDYGDPGSNTYYANQYQKDNQIAIFAFSACFVLTGDQWAGDDF